MSAPEKGTGGLARAAGAGGCLAPAINAFIRDRDGSRFINVTHVAVARIFGDYVDLESPRGSRLGTVTLEAWQRFLQRQHGGAEGRQDG